MVLTGIDKENLPHMEFKDAIYGNVVLPRYIVDIINTSAFQRLKDVTQLGPTPLLLPKANHTRYDHCIGTYIRARHMLECLESNTCNGEYKIPQLLGEAVKIAALLHDVGHGPFSHTWEYICDYKFHHENNAFACIDDIFTKIPAHPELSVLYENDNYGIQLIKALIVGDPKALSKPLSTHFMFVFDIVNNKHCGVDVDKWDYLKRDHYYLRERCNPSMQFDDIFMKARIADNGERVEYRHEDYHKIYMLYEARYYLHKECYRMPVLLACNELLRRMIRRSKATINGRRLYEIDADVDYSAFCQLQNPNVLSIIKDDEEFKYLYNLNLIVQLDNQKLKDSAENILIVNDEIPGPGTAMPNDEQFCFYGNASLRKNITRNKTAVLNVFYYQLIS